MTMHAGTAACVTTTRRIRPDRQLAAYALAKQLHLPFLQRGELPIHQLLAGLGMTYALIVENEGITLTDGLHKLKWHPNMSGFKLRDIALGIANPMLKAMAVQAGDSVLDCTLGLAGDAIVAASAVGSNGRVIGLEGNPLIAYLTASGLREYRRVSDAMQEAMQRIEVISMRYEAYLETAACECFDCVYFDPMFEVPVNGAMGMAILKPFALQDALTVKTIKKAKAVCRKRVVVKLRRDSALIDSLKGFQFVGRKRGDEVGFAFYTK